MSDLEARIAEAVNAHTTAAFAGADTACSCDRTWRRNADHRKHVSESLTAMLAPLIREAKAEAIDVLAKELNERNKLARTAPNMVPYQRGRADSYESAFILADRHAIKLRSNDE